MMGLDLKDPLEAALVFASHAEGLEARLRKIANKKFWREALDDYRKDVDKLLRPPLQVTRTSTLAPLSNRENAAILAITRRPS